MARVVCEEVKPGLRDSERTVAVRDVRGNLHYLRVDADFLTKAGGKYYLPVGAVGEDAVKGFLLVELPVEADSGANRIWVRKSQVPEEVEAAP
jgi:hypothetical protein